MTTMVLTMPRQMKGTSYVLLIAFLACFLPLGQFATVIADDDRGAWDVFVDVCKVLGGVTGAVASANIAVGGLLSSQPPDGQVSVPPRAVVQSLEVLQGLSSA